MAAGPADARNHAPKNKSEAEEEKQPEQWFITGANGNLGQRLIRKLLSEGAMITRWYEGRAERELTRVFSSTRQLRIEVIDYAETMLLSQAAYWGAVCCASRGNSKSSKHATYATAHEASCTSLSRALKDTSVEHITYLSILGANQTLTTHVWRPRASRANTLPMPNASVHPPRAHGDWRTGLCSKMLSQRANLKVPLRFVPAV